MRETDGAFSATCQTRSTTWKCYAVDGDGSGGADYRVELHGRCWTAHLTEHHAEEGPPLPDRAAACVMFRDQVRLMDR